MKKIFFAVLLLILMPGCSSNHYLLDSASMKDSERSCLSVNGAIDIITINDMEVNIIGDKIVHAPTDVYLPAGKYELGLKYRTGSGRCSSGIIAASIELGAGKKYKMWYYEENGLVHFTCAEIAD